MRTTPNRLMVKALAAAVGLVLALGCTLHKAQVAFEEGHYDEALAQYRQVLRKDPNNIKAKIGYRKTAPLAAEVHLAKAKEAEKAGREDVVRREVAAAVVLDPSNAVAIDKMNRIEEAAERRRNQQEAEESVDAMRLKGESKAVLPINPRSMEGLDLNFTRKTSLREIFQQLSKNSGVNIILHQSASQQDISISVDLRGLTFQRILDTLMLQSDLFYRVMDTNTIMVFKKTVQNLQDFENKLIRTFYLSNADVDGVRQIFNAIMPQLRVFVDKRINAITVMAKSTDLVIAQRIVNQLDKAKAEVMIYIELMEVSESATEAVGLLPMINPTDTKGTYRLGATLDSGNASAPNTNKGAIRINKSDVKFLFPSLALDLLKSNGDSKMLASPNVRVVSGETGEVNIGDKVSTTQSSLGIPGVNTGSTAGTAATAGSSIGGIATAQTQYSYEEVGVKIKVKPRVHFNGDITIELESDVKTLKSSTDPGRPNIGQRIIKTSARLRDGEVVVFGGLLKEEEQKTLQGIWGVTDIPVIGKLLGNTSSTSAKTDVLLTLRAVVVRKPDFGPEDFEAFDPDNAPNSNKPFAPKPERRDPSAEFDNGGAKTAPSKPTPPAAASPAPAAMAPVPPTGIATNQPGAMSAQPSAATTQPNSAISQASAGTSQPGAMNSQPSAAGATPSQAAGLPNATAGLPSVAANPTSAAAGQAGIPAAPMTASETSGPAPAAAGATTAKATDKAPAPPEPSDLVFFMDPMSGSASKGQKQRVTIYASGAGGVTEGSMDLRLDSRLKLTSATAGDFLTADGGSMEQVPGMDGALTLKFKRKTGSSDSGTLVVLDLDCAEVGKATVLINGGTYKIGANPVSARVVNAMITIE